jgi:glycerol kinase
MPYLLALDQGTTSSRAILFDTEGRQHALAQKEFPQHYPSPGHVEHNPQDIWQTQLAVAREVLATVNIADVAAIGITNQRETTLLWDKATGQPLHNAIVWQDRRTADLCSQWKREHLHLIQQKTGLIPDAYFSASKLRWLLDNLPNARQRALRGELAFGTVDSWLLYNLTRHPTTQDSGLRTLDFVHATDLSNASRTMLFNIHTCQWDPELLQLFNIPPGLLPEVKNSAGLFGTTTLFGKPIPITGIAGDQQAALFGQTCFSPGLAKNTYGTGCFLLSNLGTTPTLSKNQLLTTIAWRLSNSLPNEQSRTSIGNRQSATGNSADAPNGPPIYALEGSVFVGGAVVQWLRDGLGIIQSASEIESLASSVPDSGGLYLVPAFAGLGAPHWDQYARGTITGITRGTTRAHFARAALEAIAFQVADLLDVFHADTTHGTHSVSKCPPTVLPDGGSPAQAAITSPQENTLKELRVDGGAARNDLLLQFQADLLQVPVIRPKITETTALGAAFLAGLGAGLFQSTADLAPLWHPDRTFHPQLPRDHIAARRARWQEALTRARAWEKPA